MLVWFWTRKFSWLTDYGRLDLDYTDHPNLASSEMGGVKLFQCIGSRLKTNQDQYKIHKPTATHYGHTPGFGSSIQQYSTKHSQEEKQNKKPRQLLEISITVTDWLGHSYLQMGPIPKCQRWIKKKKEKFFYYYLSLSTSGLNGQLLHFPLFKPGHSKFEQRYFRVCSPGTGSPLQPTPGMCQWLLGPLEWQRTKYGWQELTFPHLDTCIGFRAASMGSISL